MLNGIYIKHLFWTKSIWSYIYSRRTWRLWKWKWLNLRMKQITAVAMVSPSQATLRRATPWNGKALPSKHPNINKIPRRASRRSAELICEADGKFQPSVYIAHLSWSTPAWVVAKILDSTWKLRVQLADSARHETGPTIAFYWQKYREMKMKICAMSLKNQLGV